MRHSHLPDLRAVASLFSTTLTSRSSSATTSRLRAQGDHRDLLHRPRSRARRHPLLPLRRRAAPRSSTSSTCPAGWPTRRPSPGSTSAAARPSSSATRARQVRGAAACLRPLRASPCTAATSPPATSAPSARTWTSSPGSAATSPGGPSRTAAPATPRCSRRTASSRACAPPPRRRWGSPVAGRAHRRRRRRRQGRPPPGPPPRRGRRARWSSPTCPATPSQPSRPTTRRSARSRTRMRWSPRRSTSTPRARWAARCPTTVVEVLQARIVCGAANNQLAHPGVDKLLEEHGVLYAPDYVVNAGGLIQVADELEGFSFERARQRAAGIYDTTHGSVPAGPRGGRPARSRGGPARRAADGRGLAPAPDPPVGRVQGVSEGARQGRLQRLPCCTGSAAEISRCGSA